MLTDVCGILFLQGTADLALRLGMNSGPTTAGVLRGEKSRFQLFGDVRKGLACIVHLSLGLNKLT
jgi:hypothetical protein